MTIKFVSRAKSSPYSTKEVSLNFYERAIPNNGSITSWSSEINVNDTISLPSSTERFQYDQITDTLANWGLTAGQLHQIEITRDYDASPDTLSGDWLLLELTFTFS